MKRMPIKWVREFALQHGLRQVIVAAWDGETTHVVTVGRTAIDCDQAAQGGEKIKAAFGWPYDPTCVPSRVKTLRRDLAKLTSARGALESLRESLRKRQAESAGFALRDERQGKPLCAAHYAAMADAFDEAASEADRLAKAAAQ